MTFTYSSTSIGTALAKVRLQIGDTDSTDPLFTDEEINYHLSVHSDDVIPTAIALCDVLATRFAREFDFETDDQKFARSQRQKAYAARAAELRAQADSGLSVLGQTKVDGYSQDIAADEVSGSETNRASVGYWNPDRSW